jgi:mannosyl-oligosaccharide alpha-1,2-mannosidase
MKRIALLSILSISSAPVILAGVVQNPSLALPSDAAQHRQAVVDIFLTSYNAYK